MGIKMIKNGLLRGFAEGNVSPKAFLNAASEFPFGKADPSRLRYLRTVNNPDPVEIRIDLNTMKVTGHDGRHRSVVAIEKGQKSIPAYFIFERNKKMVLDLEDAPNVKTVIGQKGNKVKLWR